MMALTMEREMRQWFRTCQACGHVQQATEPKGKPSDAYLNAKCRKCKSEAFDYGSSADPRLPAEDYTAWANNEAGTEGKQGARAMTRCVWKIEQPPLPAPCPQCEAEIDEQCKLWLYPAMRAATPLRASRHELSLARSLAYYVSEEDGGLDRVRFLRIVISRIQDDLDAGTQ